MRFEGDLFMLLWTFILLNLSPREFIFHEVILIVSSGDFEGHVWISTIGFYCRKWIFLIYCINCEGYLG